jgi:putative flavoprotein involved in K+ transport
MWRCNYNKFIKKIGSREVQMSASAIKGTGDKGETHSTIVIGGGQAGLAAGYFLAREGQDFIIMDKEVRTGDAWRKRWDSLRLFTPSQFDNLPGMAFPKPRNYLPSKDEAADYLEEYALHFKLPVRHGIAIDGLERNGDGYILSSGSDKFFARNVIIATGSYQAPYTPSFASQIDHAMFQMHSATYRNPQQVDARSVLVVGSGNSGTEIAIELANAGRQVWLSGRDPGRLPVHTPIGKLLGGRPLWWAVTHLVTLDTPIGRKIKEKTMHRGGPLGQVRRDDAVNAGVNLIARVAGVEGGTVRLEDGSAIPAEGVLWATGFRPDYSWIKLPIFDVKGYPVHMRGIVQSNPGLYFLGLFFQSGLSSSFLGGVGRDAAYIAGQIKQNN